MKNPLYYKCSQVFDLVEESNYLKSLKTALYEITYPEDKDFKRIYCICVETDKNKTKINQIIKEIFDCDKITYESLGLTNGLLKVLLYELYFSGRRLKMGGKEIKYIKSKKEEINSILGNISKKAEFIKKEIVFRLMEKRFLYECNLIDDKINDFEIKKFIDEHCIKDNFIKNLFALKNVTDDTKKFIFSLRDSNYIKIQSRSSCLPAFLLSLIKNKNFDEDEKVDIVDSCSSPGNKTLQLSEYFQYSNIYAFEKDIKRFDFLNKNTNICKRIVTSNLDFLNVNPLDKKYKNVKIILVDPSCSGSGILNNISEMSFDNDLNPLNTCCLKLANLDSNYKDKERLNNLADFQIKILLHAMEFSNVKLISYSTCSIFVKENEHVVREVLKSNKNFKLYDINKINNEDFEISEFTHEGIKLEENDCKRFKNNRLIRSCYKCFKDEGFFVTIFEKKSIEES